MTKNQLKSIIFNYRRNKKRMKQIQNDYYSLGIPVHDGQPIGQGRKSDQVASKVIRLHKNNEYIRLKKETEAVDRMELTLGLKERIVYLEYFIRRNSVEYIDKNKGISKRSVFRYINSILDKLRKEIGEIPQG